jgi:hypothetical protein
MHRDCQAMAGWGGAMCLNCCDLYKQESWATRKNYAKLPNSQSLHHASAMRKSGVSYVRWAERIRRKIDSVLDARVETLGVL